MSTEKQEVSLTSNGFIHAPSVFGLALNYKRQGNTREWALGLLDAMHIPQSVAVELLDGKREYRIDDEDAVVVPMTREECAATVALSQRR